MEAIVNTGMVNLIAAPVVILFLGAIALFNFANVLKAISYLASPKFARSGGLQQYVSGIMQYFDRFFSTVVGDAATIKFTLDHVLSVSILVALVVVASAALQRASAERRESASSSRAPRAPKPEAKAD